MTPRLRLCIPVYDNPATIARVVESCLVETPYPVLVVDDGSARPVASLLSAPLFLEASRAGRLTLLRHPRNRGKGRALQTAFARCLEDGFTHALSLDGDGQHLPSELKKIAAAVERNPWAVVIGNRQMEDASVPEISRFGRRFSNFWVRYETDNEVEDSQCGLRAYPLFHLQGKRWWTGGFEFEIEVLIRLMWKGVKVIGVPVAVRYPPDRVSHFDKLRDNARISTLNALLVTLRLFRLGREPRPAATALGLGVFLGCTPFYGFHTLLAGAAALLFRLNAGLLWLGTQVSFPAFAPFLLAASLKVGAKVRGAPLPQVSLTAEFARASFTDWLIGSLVVGAVLGIGVGAATWLALTISKRKAKTARGWNGRIRGGAGNHLMKAIARHVGLGAAYFVLYFVVPYFYLFAPRARRALAEYWRLARPEARALSRARLTLRHMHRFGQLILDRVAQSQSKSPLFTIESHGFDHIRQHLEKKEGVLLLGAHAGGWDLVSSSIYRHELRDPFYLVQHRPQGRSIDSLKSSKDVTPAQAVFANQEAMPVLSMHRLLDEGRVVALMGDRPVGKHFELVKFFGRLAPFDTTAFRVAAATGKPLVFAFGFKHGAREYHAFAHAARYYKFAPGEDRARKCTEWAQEFASVLEGHVRRYEDQWLNFFPFWSTAPA